MFTHLHLHTDYSLLDGLGKVKDYAKKAKALGMTALAITDHGTMAGVVSFSNACKEAGIKPIIGCEVYEAPESRLIHSAKMHESYAYHLVLLAKNETGYRNLCKLTTKANVEGFYYKPRIDRALLKDYSEGLICLSGCLAGRIAKDIQADDYELVKKDIQEYKEIFGDDFYLEIQDHGILAEKKVSTFLRQYSEEVGVKVVATNDCHYVEHEDSVPHEWLLAMQTGKKISDDSRLTYTGDYSLKSEEEMRSLFPNCQEAFDNTMEIVDKCVFAFDEKPVYRMPKVVIPQEWGTDYYGYMEHLAWEGFESRYPIGHEKREEAIPRLKYELSVVKNMNFAEYFLDTRKTIFWSHDHNILTGVGRGSGAGSCLNYCLGITELEPLKYGLLFERFLNPSRISMPDIDVDYEKRFSEEVIRSEAESNGYDKFARIQTFNTMKAKSVIKDCIRTADLPVSVGVDIAKLIGKDGTMTLQKAYDTNATLQEYIKTHNLEEIWKIALRLEGTKKSAGVHACGCIPTPVPCEDLFPCRVDEKTGYLICQYDMTEVEQLGNLKKDILVLRNLSIIAVANKAIKDRYAITVPLWEDNILNDKDALAMISAGKTDGIFQLESDGMKSFMKKLKPSCFEDIIAGVALYRPGPMDNISTYIHNKYHSEDIVYISEKLRPILENTYGIIVYQEQVMQIVQALAGFTMAEADVVRKAMGKKKEDVMEKEKEKFVYGNEEFIGCIKNGIEESKALALWEQMKEFAKYAFNKSHAAAYACVSMQTAYLKAHYPLEYNAGLLSSVMDDTEKLAGYYKEALRDGVEVLCPDVNTSYAEFMPTDEGRLTYGLSAIKGLGDSCVQDILKEREENGAYTSFYDFILRTGGGNKIMKPLIYSGAFDSFGTNRATLEQNLASFQSKAKKEIEKNTSGQFSLFDYLPDISSGTPDFVECQEWDVVKKAMKEKESTGIFVKTNPLTQNTYPIDYTPLAEVLENTDGNYRYSEGEEITLHAIITETKYHTTKKNDRMAFLKVEDATDSLDIVVFPETLKQLYEKGRFLNTNDIVTVKGTVSFRGEIPNIICKNLYNEDQLESLYQKHLSHTMER